MNEILFLFILLFALILIRMPVAFAMGSASLITVLTYDFPLGLLAGRTLDAMDKWIWIAIPLFILLGTLMNEAGITDRLIDFCDKLIGHIAGGLSHVNVGVSMLLAGMSGSTLADAAGVGKLLIPSMKRHGYSAGYSAAMTAISAVIGSIIPPSINFIIVGTLADISILRMWLGGIIPGIIIGLFLIVAGYFISKKRHYTPARKMAPFREIARSTYYALPALIVPIVIIGGMRLGVFTPTEAAAAGVVYIACVGFFVYRGLSIRKLAAAAWDCGITSGAILWLVAMGTVFGMILHLCRASDIATEYFLGITQNKIIFLLVFDVVLLIMGCLMEIMAVILIMLPIAAPMAAAFGIDPVHFGVLFGFITVVGQSTPPIGLTLYITTGIAECSVQEYVREGWILWIPMVAAILLFTFCPQLILWLPNLIMGSTR
jgi:tripartite ATP-independent transporter DctM subunit